MKDKLPANCYENLGLGSDVEGFPRNALTLEVKRFISNQSFQPEETPGKKGENPRKKLKQR